MSFTDALFNYFGREIKELVLIPSKGGLFEITVNGKLIYSKKKTGDFPNEKEVLKQIDAM